MTTRTVAADKFEGSLRIFGCITGILIGTLMASIYTAHLGTLVTVAGISMVLWLLRIVYLCLSPLAPAVAASDGLLHLEIDRQRLERLSGRRARIARAYETFMPFGVLVVLLTPGVFLGSGICAWVKPALLFKISMGVFLLVIGAWAGLVMASRRELARLRRAVQATEQP